jgi:hypothetical protein
MPKLNPEPLSTSGRRALAAAMLGTATQLPPLVCSLLIDALDVVCGAVLATAGATPQESRALLSTLWHQDGDPEGRTAR